MIIRKKENDQNKIRLKNWKNERKGIQKEKYWVKK